MGNSKSSLTRSEYDYIIHASTDEHAQLLWKYKPSSCSNPRCHEIDWFLGPILLSKNRTCLPPQLSLSRRILASVFNPSFGRHHSQERDNKKGAETFERFNDLPMELRIKIVRMAAEPCHELPTEEFWFFMLCLRERHRKLVISRGCSKAAYDWSLKRLPHFSALLMIARRWGFKDRLSLMRTSWLCREIVCGEMERWVRDIEFNGAMGDPLKRALMGEMRMVKGRWGMMGEYMMV